ncbi:MAG: radical SAM protein [Candidatus Hodarchaeales archaeon]
MIRIRNERYGGTSFNQKDGEFFRFNHEVMELIIRYTHKQPLTSEELDFLESSFPSFRDESNKYGFLIKKKLKSPYTTPLVSEGPEFVDLSLGTKCNSNCPYCYTSSSKNGEFISLKDYYRVLSELEQNRVYQVAIGGGEPTMHPNFIHILQMMREEYSIIPNYTTNGTLITEELAQISSELCGAVALSYHNNREKDQLKVMELLSNSGVNSVLHVVADRSTLPYFSYIVRKFGEMGMRAVAFLLFKPSGRGKGLKNEILTISDMAKLDEQFQEVFNIAKDFNFTVGFDTCFAPFLTTFNRCVRGTYDSCTGARVSAYIDWDLTVRPCSFMQDDPGVSMKNFSLEEIWWGEYFDSFRKELLRAHHEPCKHCQDFLYCFGGCPFHHQIVLCKKRQ